MQITQPTAEALPEICALYQTVIADMHARGLFQWRWGQYPYETLLQKDIALGQLYRIDDEDGLAGVFALVTGGQEPEYREIDWQLGDNPVCLHRIAVLPIAAAVATPHKRWNLPRTTAEASAATPFVWTPIPTMYAR